VGQEGLTARTKNDKVIIISNNNRKAVGDPWQASYSPFMLYIKNVLEKETWPSFINISATMKN
jgi:hypothetical protein